MRPKVIIGLILLAVILTAESHAEETLLVEQVVPRLERLLTQNDLATPVLGCGSTVSQQRGMCSKLVSEVRANLQGRWYDWPARKLGLSAPFDVCSLNSTTPAYWSPLSNEQDFLQTVSSSSIVGLAGINFEEMSCLSDSAPIGERMALAAFTPMLAGRLQLTLEGLLGEYLAASSLLGEGNEILSTEPICVGTSPALESYCSQWRNCRPVGGLTEVAKRLSEHWPAYHTVVKQREKLAQRNCGRNPRSLCISERAQGLERLDRIVQYYQQMFPFLASDKVKKIHRQSNAPSEQVLAQAIEQDLRARRETLGKLIHELSPQLSCLSDPLRRAQCELDFDLIRQKTSPLVVLREGLSRQEQKTFDAMALADCVFTAQGYVEEGSGIIWDATISAAVTVATAPITMPALALTRTVAQAGRVAMATRSSAPLLKLAGQMKGSATVGGALKAAAVMTAAGLDTLGSKDAVLAIGEACSDMANVPQEVTAPICPERPESVINQAIFQTQECLLANALGMAQMLPYIPASASILTRLKGWQVALPGRSMPASTRRFAFEQELRLTQMRQRLGTYREKLFYVPADMANDRVTLRMNELLRAKGVATYNPLNPETLQKLKPGVYSFALMPNEKTIRLSRTPNLGHGSITDFAPVRAAGEVVIGPDASGVMRVLEIGLNTSGHYRPDARAGLVALEAMVDARVELPQRIFRHSDKHSDTTLLGTKAVELVAEWPSR